MIGYFRQEFFIVFKFWLVGVVLSIIVSCLRAIFCGLLTMLEDRTEIGRDLMNRGERLSVFSLSHSFLTCSCSDFKQSTAYWTDQLFCLATTFMYNSYVFQTGLSTIEILSNG